MVISSQLINPCGKNRRWSDLLRFSSECKGIPRLLVADFNSFLVSTCCDANTIANFTKIFNKDTKNLRNASMHLIYMDNEESSTLSYPMDIKTHLSEYTHINRISMTT
jgi:hypothetical protein